MAEMKLLLNPEYMNPELEPLLKAGPPAMSFDGKDIPALRSRLLENKRKMTAANADSTAFEDIQEIDHQIPTRDASEITIRVYNKKSSTHQNHPIMIMFHGGGFYLGGLDNEALLCREFCTEFNGVRVNVDYRLAPEHVFPTAVHDGYDALKWVAANASSIGGSPSAGFILAGISAGGNVAAVLSHLALSDAAIPSISGMYLSIPTCFGPSAVPEKYKHEYLSYEELANAPVLGRTGMNMLHSLYEDDESSPLRSPILFNSHEKLPKHYFQICGLDPIRDEGLIYAKALGEAGVEIKMSVYPGLPHSFWSWWPTATFSKKQQEDSIEGFKWLLH